MIRQRKAKRDPQVQPIPRRRNLPVDRPGTAEMEVFFHQAAIRNNKDDQLRMKPRPGLRTVKKTPDLIRRILKMRVKKIHPPTRALLAHQVLLIPLQSQQRPPDRMPEVAAAAVEARLPAPGPPLMPRLPL